MTTLWVDSDGVFADFDLHVKTIFGKSPREFGGDQNMWAAITAHEPFWETMPVMEGSVAFWNAVKHLSPIVLTGCPKTNYEGAASAKRAWWQKHFGHFDVITCLSRDKATHMKAPGDILIDDMSKNIKRWEAAGGIGIFHRHYRYDDTLARLNALISGETT